MAVGKDKAHWLVGAWLGVLVAGYGAVVAQTPRVPTQPADFFLFGTQPISPGPAFDQLYTPSTCAGCHGEFDKTTAPYERWRYSMMAHATRDPIFLAALQVANKDAAGAGDLCLRCHTPAGWVQKRARVTDGTGLINADLNGISCAVCHRMVDPAPKARSASYDPAPRPNDPEYINNPEGVPEIDPLILDALGSNRPPNFTAQGQRPGGPLNANGFVIDPQDRRRGPFPLAGTFSNHEWLESPFHRESGLCASCHDVSNPVLERQADGTYAPGALGLEHSTGNKYDMFPLDRTYSEWLKSAFAQGPVTLTVPNPNGTGPAVGRYSFDGVTRVDPLNSSSAIRIFNSATSYSTCQNCHMPRTTGEACDPAFGPVFREDTNGVPVHNFSGVNNWVLKAVADLYPSNLIGLIGSAENPFKADMSLVDESIQRNIKLREKASDMELQRIGAQLKVRLINQTGHKFPTGYTEGRRVWINVKYYDAGNNLVAERGAYEPTSAVLSESDTKVYQIKMGLDSTMATVAGLPEGPSFHLDIANKRFFDNRIPPRGFTNSAFAAIQADPVGYSYQDGQYWDDTFYTLPPTATRAEVRVYGQITSKQYAEFLRDEGDVIQPTGTPITIPQPGGTTWTAPAGTPPAPLTVGQIAYAQWVKWGKSAPVLMDSMTLAVRYCPADVATVGGAIGADNQLTADDIIVYLAGFFAENKGVADIATLGGGAGPDGQITADDLIFFLQSFFSQCP